MGTKFVNKGSIGWKSPSKFSLASVLICLIFSNCRAPLAKEASRIETPELVAELVLSPQPELGSASAKIIFSVTAGWHIYGSIPQKNGRPTSVVFSPDPETAVVWPQTETFDEGVSGKSEGYQGQFELSAKFSKLPQEVGASISWVACKNICVPGQAELRAR